MGKIIQAEIYKIYKKGYFFTLCFLSLLPLLYGLGAYFQWDVITIGVKLDLITFITSMWTFTLILTIPMILLLMIVTSSLSTEISEGQILLEITRVLDKKKLVFGKFIANLLTVLGFYIMNIFVSIATYIFFLSKTSKGYANIFTTNSYNGQSILISIANLLFLLFLMSVSFYFSVNKSTIVSTLVGFGTYLICIFLGYIPFISECVPGYFMVVSDYNFSRNTIILQYIELIILIALLLLGTMIKFQQKEY